MSSLQAPLTRAQSHISLNFLFVRHDSANTRAHHNSKAQSAPEHQMGTSGCPFSGGAHTAGDISKCPMAAQIMRHVNDTTTQAAPATCPLGFGTARGPKLSTLHCPVCKGLLFDAHSVVSCKHTFCKSCISRTRDCPSCGRDVDGLEPNSELAGLVNTFLDTHSQSPQLVAAQADLGPLPDSSAASFYMAQGLKSMAGGNIHAALHRLGKAKQSLLESQLAPHTPSGVAPAAAAAAGTPPTALAAAAATVDGSQSGGDSAAAMQVDAALDVQSECGTGHQQQQQQQQGAGQDALGRAVQLATVCGCLGDCYQRMGDADQAEQLYKESVAAVQPYSEESAEAAHAMSVSLNKLGDGRYLSQQLPAAKQLYKQALQLRQLCCGPLTSGQAGPQQQLELASSLIKVADVCKALGETDEADSLLRRAHGVCCEVQALQDDHQLLPPAVMRKLELLMGVLQAQGQHLGVQGAPAGAAAAAAAAAASDS